MLNIIALKAEKSRKAYPIGNRLKATICKQTIFQTAGLKRPLIFPEWNQLQANYLRI